MLVIDINWEFFLGIVGTLMAMGYYANGRFTKLETSVEWLKSAVDALTQASMDVLRTGKRRSRRDGTKSD